MSASQPPPITSVRLARLSASRTSKQISGLKNQRRARCTFRSRRRRLMCTSFFVNGSMPVYYLHIAMSGVGRM
jgi:hypothetical protein